jgi:hypothetical protein
MRSAWPARLRSLTCSLIHSTHIDIKRPKVQAHASECYRGCCHPLGVPALSDQFAAVAVTMGERLGSDDANRSAHTCRVWAARSDVGWVVRGALIGRFWASVPAPWAVSFSARADLVRLVEMCGKRRWWCGKDVSPVPWRCQSAMPGGVVRVVGVPPVMAVLACFPAVGRCADNGLRGCRFEGGAL